MSKHWESGIGERAAGVQSRHLALRRAYDARDGSKRADELWRDAAAAFHTAVHSFYAPYDEILVGVRLLTDTKGEDGGDTLVQHG